MDPIVEDAAEDVGRCFEWHPHQTSQRHPKVFLSREKTRITISRAIEDASYELRRVIETLRYYMNDDNEAMVDEAMARGEFMEPATYGEFDPCSCYNCRKVFPLAEIEFVTHDRPWCQECLGKIRCQHEWVDATNEVIESGEVCTKCFAVRATVSKEEKELQKQRSMPFKYIYLGGERYEVGSEEAAIAEHLEQEKTIKQFGEVARKAMGVDIGNRDAKELECVEKIIAPDSGAELVIKVGQTYSIVAKFPDVLPNPVLLCDCCADRGKWWKFNPHCEVCNQTGWSDKGVWAKDRDHEETEYAMDLSMYLCSFMQPRASELAVRLAFHIEQTTTYVPDASKLIDQVMQGDTKRIDLLEAFAGTSEQRGVRDKGLIVFPDGSIRGALPGDKVEKIGQTVREAIDLCTHEPNPERDYVEGRTSDENP